MQDLINRGGPWSTAEKERIIDYCGQDVSACTRLLTPMLRDIDLGRALYRGRYMSASAQMEFNGIPIDKPTLTKLKERWSDIQDALIAKVDSAYNCFEARTFKEAKFEAWLDKNEIPSPRHPSGQLDLSRETFKNVVSIYPAVAPLRELRTSLSEMRLNALQVGPDGRNRLILSPFKSKTSRNQPSNSKFIFGPSRWLRGLIKPPPGHGVAYIDYGQQELGIAAALSGDKRMQDAYNSGDPYLEFARQAGAVPPGGTRHTHRREREQFKQAMLAVQYGMGGSGLSNRIGSAPALGRGLIRLHQETYRGSGSGRITPPTSPSCGGAYPRCSGGG